MRANLKILPEGSSRAGLSTMTKGGRLMDILVERCTGLDVHGDSVAACVRIPGPVAPADPVNGDILGPPRARALEELASSRANQLVR
jgi:hypothetical protein